MYTYAIDVSYKLTNPYEFEICTIEDELHRTSVGNYYAMEIRTEEGEEWSLAAVENYRFYGSDQPPIPVEMACLLPNQTIFSTITVSDDNFSPDKSIYFSVRIIRNFLRKSDIEGFVFVDTDFNRADLGRADVPTNLPEDKEVLRLESEWSSYFSYVYEYPNTTHWDIKE